MAGIALLLDLLKRGGSGPSSSTVLHSHGFFSAAAAASAAAALAAAGRPLAGRPLIFGDGGFNVAYCDAGVAVSEREIAGLTTPPKSLSHDSLNYRAKTYPLELKPLFSAFEFRAFTMTTLRSFLIYYLPLMEPRPHLDEDDLEEPEEKPVDLVTPFKNSIKQIARETSVVTTRRVLERIAVHYVSERMAWKLLKDASKSAKRKAARGMPTILYIHSVGKTTLRGYALGIAASWIVQIIIEIYGIFIRQPENETEVNEKLKLFAKKAHKITVRCGASLIFASVGAGIGAVFHPSYGQWIGSALGDLSGPIVVEMLSKNLHLDLL